MNTEKRPPWATDKTECNCGNEDKPADEHEATCPVWIRGDADHGSLASPLSNEETLKRILREFERATPLDAQRKKNKRGKASAPMAILAAAASGAALLIALAAAAMVLVKVSEDARGIYTERGPSSPEAQADARYQRERAKVQTEAIEYAVSNIYDAPGAYSDRATIDPDSVTCVQVSVQYGESPPIPVGWNCHLPGGVEVHKDLITGAWSEVAR